MCDRKGLKEKKYRMGKIMTTSRMGSMIEPPNMSEGRRPGKIIITKVSPKNIASMRIKRKKTGSCESFGYIWSKGPVVFPRASCLLNPSLLLITMAKSLSCYT
jgi:hypothetical protein